MSTRTSLALRYFIWSMLIFAISMSLWGFHALRPSELKIFGASLPLRQYPSYRYLKEIEMPFLSIPIYGQVSEERYLEIARDVVHHLKKAGAKTVIVPLPEGLLPTRRVLRAIEGILRDSIAILGAPNPLTSGYRPFGDPDFGHRSRWWVHHPLYNQREIPWGIMSAYAEYINPVIRFVPVGFRETKTGAQVPDVAVLALRRFFDIPDNAVVQPYASRVQVGSYTIPLAKDDIAYLRYAHRPKVQFVLGANHNFTSDSIEYFPDFSGAKPGAEPLENLWAKHQGKIVFLDWLGIRQYQTLNYSWLYVQIFGSVFQRSFLSIHNEWNVLLITTLVILLSVFSYTMRNGLTVLLSFALLIAMIALSLWLFDSHNVIFDPIYALVPIVLCGCILPIVKTSGEKKIAEATVKSLEGENKRLLELQRRSTQDPQF